LHVTDSSIIFGNNAPEGTIRICRFEADVRCNGLAMS
jgi:hypothetical protein